MKALAAHCLAAARFLLIGIVFGLSGLAQAASPAAAPLDTAPHTCSVDPDHAIFDGMSWYGLYWEGAKVGHMNGSAQMDGQGQIVINTHLEMTLGEVMSKVNEQKIFASKPPHDLISGVINQNEGSIHYLQRDDGIHVSSDSGLHSMPGHRWTLCDEESVSIPDQLAHLSPGAQFTSTYLDVEALEVTQFDHVLHSVEQQSIEGRHHLFQTVLSKVQTKGTTSRIRQRYRDGEALTLQLGQLEARLQSQEQALGPIERTDQIELLTVKSDGRLDASALGKIKALSVKIKIDDPLARIDEVITDGQMQRVQYVDDKTAIARIADYPAPPQPSNNGNNARLSSTDVSAYLAANFTYPVDHPRIKELAKSLRAELPTKASERTLAESLSTYVANKIRYELVGTKTVLAILDDPVGDCTEYSQLLVTLARANGLPAREVSGFIYYQDDPNSPNLGQFGGHAWVEIYIDGRWQHMDPTAGEVSPNKSHVQFSQLMVRGLEFEILDIQYY